MFKSLIHNMLLTFEPWRAKCRLFTPMYRRQRFFLRGFIIPKGRDCVFIGIAFLLFTCLSCEQNKAPLTTAQPQISLAVEDVFVTEAWLKVKVEQVKENRSITLWRDTTEVFSSIIKTADTTLYDANLLPNHNYTYRAALLKNNQPFVNSETVQITTMDTTSHDFSWTIDTIGTTSSVLYDVAIISPDDVWAVGEIHTAETDTFDSLGNWIPPYNAVHWDGSEWKLIRTEAEGYGFGENYSVFAFSSDDVWIGSTIPEHWDGQQWTFHGTATGYPGGFRIRKIWGTSSDNLYFVGDNGNIVRYNGSSWREFSFNTDLPFQDVWGATNPKTGKQEILCVASNKFLNQGKMLVLIEDEKFMNVPDSGLSWSLSGVWFMPGKRYYVVGAGIYPKRDIGQQAPWTRYPPGVVTNYFTNRIRGNDINDIVAAGAFGEVVHYNGSRWRNYYDQTQLNNGSYFSVDFKGDLMVAVGQLNQRGVIAVGRR